MQYTSPRFCMWTVKVCAGLNIFISFLVHQCMSHNQSLYFNLLKRKIERLQLSNSNRNSPIQTLTAEDLESNQRTKSWHMPGTLPLSLDTMQQGRWYKAWVCSLQPCLLIKNWSRGSPYDACETLFNMVIKLSIQ